MANQFYTPQTDVVAGGLVKAADTNAIDSAVDAAFDLLPTRDTTTGGGHKGFSTPVLVGSPTHSKHAVTLGLFQAQIGATLAVGTSVTSVTIDLGSKVFTIAEGADRAWSVGMRLEIISSTNNAFLMQGAIDGYVGDQLTISVTAALNQGETSSSWVIYPISQIGMMTEGNQIINGDQTFVGDVTTTGTTTLGGPVKNALGHNIPLFSWSLRNGARNPSCAIDTVNAGAAYTRVAGSSYQPAMDGYYFTGSSTGGQSPTAQRIAGGPDGESYYIRLTSESSVSPPASTSLGVQFNGSGYLPGLLINNSAAEFITVSLKMRSSINGAILGIGFYFGGLDYRYLASVTLDATNWTDLTITIPPLTSGASGTFDGRVFWSLVLNAGSNFLGGSEGWAVSASATSFLPSHTLLGEVSGATLDIAKVQIERGSSKTEYESPPHDLTRLLLMDYAIRVFDGRLSTATTQRCGFHAFREGTALIHVFVSRPPSAQMANVASVVHSSPTWHSASGTPTGNTVAAYNLKTSTMVTITGALTIGANADGPSGTIVTFTAGTSFGGSAGDPLLVLFGASAYAYLRS